MGHWQAVLLLVASCHPPPRLVDMPAETNTPVTDDGLSQYRRHQQKYDNRLRAVVIGSRRGSGISRGPSQICLQNESLPMQSLTPFVIPSYRAAHCRPSEFLMFPLPYITIIYFAASHQKSARIYVFVLGL